MYLQTLDIAVVVVYALFLLVLAQWVSREKPGHEKDTQDYFLAGRSLLRILVSARRTAAGAASASAAFIFRASRFSLLLERFELSQRLDLMTKDFVAFAINIDHDGFPQDTDISYPAVTVGRTDSPAHLGQRLPSLNVLLVLEHQTTA